METMHVDMTKVYVFAAVVVVVLLGSVALGIYEAWQRRAEDNADRKWQLDRMRRS